MSAYILIIFVSVGGFLLSLYLYHHKKNQKEKLVCPIGFNCDPVIHSDYSRLFGIQLEILGMLYYGVIAVSYGLAIVWPDLLNTVFFESLAALTAFAFLFSIYLTLIQALILRQWCSWCLISALFCIIIFLTVITQSDLFIGSVL